MPPIKWAKPEEATAMILHQKEKFSDGLSPLLPPLTTFQPHPTKSTSCARLKIPSTTSSNTRSSSVQPYSSFQIWRLVFPASSLAWQGLLQLSTTSDCKRQLPQRRILADSSTELMSQ
jgi:hypothetical protein